MEMAKHSDAELGLPHGAMIHSHHFLSYIRSGRANPIVVESIE
jgi:hypothetical protein